MYASPLYTHLCSHLQLLTGGSDGLQHWSINGSLLLKAPCTPKNVLSLSMLTMPSKSQEILCVSGDCDAVDVFTNYSYKAFSLEVM